MASPSNFNPRLLSSQQQLPVQERFPKILEEPGAAGDPVVYGERGRDDAPRQPIARRPATPARSGPVRGTPPHRLLRPLACRLLSLFTHRVVPPHLTLRSQSKAGYRHLQMLASSRSPMNGETEYLRLLSHLSLPVCVPSTFHAAWYMKHLFLSRTFMPRTRGRVDVTSRGDFFLSSCLCLLCSTG